MGYVETQSVAAEGGKDNFRPARNNKIQLPKRFFPQGDM